MTHAEMGMPGYPPSLAVGAGNPEAEKYGRLWTMPEYRKVAPGEALAQVFLREARPRSGAHVLDFGCGTGRGALMLAVLGGLRVTMIDFVRNCLDPEIQDALTTQAHALSFLKADLEQPLPVHAEYGFCSDVMEHIPPEKVDQVLSNILRAAQHVFFSISTTSDHCGALIGEPLHLTIQPYAWWMQKLAERDAIIHWSARDETSCQFYVTAWATGRDVVKSGVLNAEDEQIRANVRHNIAQGWQQIRAHGSNDLECMIVGGGPSLAGFTEEIKAKRAAGMKLVTLNGAYNWALAQGLTPSATVVVDARPFNARFTHPVVPGFKHGDYGGVEGTLYFIASQCDPSVFEGLPKDRTYLFHTMPKLVEDLLTAQYGAEWHAIPGGSTVLLRAIPLLRQLGYSKFHLYGCDSCLTVPAAPDADRESVAGNGSPPDASAFRHHAYAQTENDHQTVIPVTVGGSDGRIFYCHAWMVSQAQEMLDLIRALGDVIDLAIYGDGLLAYLLTTGAQPQGDD
jgi:2-polyprenyl-3-methyl-5-hydroxy-6-metoxy-1,4-benzoquinol methylase